MPRRPVRAALVWGVFALAVAVPLAVAATSPLLAFRQPVYIVAGFAGVLGLTLLLTQPLLGSGVLPGLEGRRGRHLHRWTGAALVVAVVLHVAGLWATSPPDVIDALTFNSPTPFSAWGVIAMWALFVTAGLAISRRRLAPLRWRALHGTLALVIVTGSVVHALLIEGTMGMGSKLVLCLLVVLATARGLARLRR